MAAINNPKNRRRPATLREVAEAAGVSVMTVSNVVRGKSVRPETRQSVEDAIAKLRYRPNTSARRLRLAAQFSVGIVIADTDQSFLADPFISRVVSGLSNYLSALDYTLDVQGVSPERFEHATILGKVGNDALCAILCGPRELRRRHLAHLQRLGQPVVVFQESFPSPSKNVALVRQDDLTGGRLLGQHLARRKLRSVLFLKPLLEWCAVEQREQGLRDALAKALAPVELDAQFVPSEAFDDVVSVVTQRLSIRVPSAIVAATDSMAAAALKAVEAMGLRVPKDLTMAGFNGFDVYRYTSPTLTTVISPAYEMGHLGGELIIERLNTGQFSRRNVVLDVSLQPGESS
jgi:LacI family transcriptional regulator